MRLAFNTGVMRILRHRATRHFVALLIGCRCGRRFLHRLDRPAVVCVSCGRLRQLSTLIDELRTAEERQQNGAPRAARRSPRAA